MRIYEHNGKYVADTSSSLSIFPAETDELSKLSLTGKVLRSNNYLTHTVTTTQGYLEEKIVTFCFEGKTWDTPFFAHTQGSLGQQYARIVF